MKRGLNTTERSPDVDPERFAWLRLARSPGIGPTSFFKLLDRFGSAVRAIEAMPGLLATGRWKGVELADHDEVMAEWHATKAAMCTLLLRSDPDYPALLREIADPPPVVILRGDPSLLSRPAVAIVGARNASAHGCLIAARLASDLASHGYAIVSGLARGIDTAAHEAAVAQEGSTIAVIANGVDIAYPPENAALMIKIAERGCIVSERPLGAAPQARHFPRRNRIIAGLTKGVVVVEAAPQSGSLITARLAGEQGREVMAVPGSPMDPRHKGTNQLLRDGAHLIENAEDVMAVIGNLASVTRAPRSPTRAPPSSEVDRQETPVMTGAVTPALGDLLFGYVGHESVLIDELVRRCHASPAAVYEAILDLELEGRIERHPGGRIARKAG